MKQIVKRDGEEQKGCTRDRAHVRPVSKTCCKEERSLELAWLAPETADCEE